MSLEGLYALAARYDDADAVVVDFLAYDACDFGHVLGQGHYDVEVFLADAQSAADGLELVGAGRVLSARHGRGEVVGDDDRNVGILVDGIQEARHAGVGECAVANDGHGRPLSGVGCALGHGDAGAHVDAGVYGAVGGQEAERVASDVAEDAGVVKLAEHLVEGCVDVAVAASLAQLWWARGHDGAGGEGRGVGLGRLVGGGLSQGGAYAVGREFARAGQLAREAAQDVGVIADAAHLFLDEGLTLFHHHDALAGLQHLPYEAAGQGILAHLEQGHLQARLADVVVGYAAGYDAQGGLAGEREAVEGRLCGVLLQLGLLCGDHVVATAGIGGQQHPVGGHGVVVQGVLRAWLGLHLDDGAGVCHACGDAHQYGQALAFAVVEGEVHHVVGLLLAGGFQGGYHGKAAVEAAVLLVLAGVHGGVVGHQHYDAAVDARHGAVDEWVGADVQSDVLHAHQCALAHVGHAQGGLHGCLLVGAPAAVYAALASQRTGLDVLRNLGRGSARIGIDARQPGVQCTQSHGFVAK